MDSKVNYTVVGVFLVVLLVAAIIIFFWMTAFRRDKAYNTYLVYIRENVTGLSVQSPVRFNGVPVGFVKKVELDPRNPQLVRITLRIEEGTPITTGTVATMQFKGITGVLYLGLKAKVVGAPLLKAKPGQKYPVIAAEPSILVQLSEVLPEVAKNVELIGDSINRLLDDKNQKAIRASLQNIEKFTQTLADNSKILDASMKSLNTTLHNSSVASQQLPDVMKQLSETLSFVKQASKQVDAAAYGLKNVMTDSRITLQNFSNQVMPSAQQAIGRFNTVASSLQQVVGEFQRNPSMLIRGKQPAPPGPGEN